MYSGIILEGGHHNAIVRILHTNETLWFVACDLEGKVVEKLLPVSAICNR